jgi:two-component system, NtrC family, sensor kinase
MKKSTIILCILLVTGITGSAQNNRIDSLKYIVETAANDSIRFEALDDLCFYYTWANPDSALIYAHKQLVLANKFNTDIMQARALMSTSIALSVTGNYSQALNLALNALRITENSENQRPLFGIYTYLCLIYRDQGDFNNARSYAFKELANYNNSKIALGHVGSVYEKFNNLDSALFYINKAYEIENKTNSKWTLLPNTMGNIYVKKGDYKLALQFYRQGIFLAKNQNIVRDLVDMYAGMANIFLKTGQNDSCIYYTKEIIKINKKATYPLSAMEAANLLSNLYKSQNNKDSIIKYLEFTTALKDSLFSREKQRQFQNISLSEELRAQEIKATQQKYRSRLRTNSFLGSAFTLFVIAIFLFIIIRRKQKAKQKIESAFNQLKSTQAQLIQSEKMASLGELTAGIAHEIQNPLNFVNNFSEISSELIDEMNEELDKADIEEAKAISTDIKLNLKKINHHGKRADAIVKGMLQHSRSSNGTKEPTDINALAGEYLRLSYHGMLAKNNSRSAGEAGFDAEYKTDFDPNLPKINIIPQDIGRVLLNLINNAFYAVHLTTQHAESLHQTSAEQPDYKPMVMVSTKNTGTHVEIRVKDNGPGIPSEIKDKIFQPFFTTKPTGQGTGLGLSLSYDIVKAHGGKLKVETLEGEGTEFIVQLPV